MEFLDIFAALKLQKILFKKTVIKKECVFVFVWLIESSRVDNEAASQRGLACFVGGKDRCWIDHGFSPFFLFIY
jgi:hypothetical protein